MKIAWPTDASTACTISYLCLAGESADRFAIGDLFTDYPGTSNEYGGSLIPGGQQDSHWDFPAVTGAQRCLAELLTATGGRVAGAGIVDDGDGQPVFQVSVHSPGWAQRETRPPAVTAPAASTPLVEVLVVRDPDAGVFADVWVDGVLHPGAVIVTVDPGAGWMRTDWEQASDTVTGSPDFVAAARAAYNDNADSQFIIDDRKP